MNTPFLEEHMNALYNGVVARGMLPGASIAVEHNGERVYTAHFGIDRADSIYRIFSMTKPITAAAALYLYERGLIDLRQPVSDFLPAFSRMEVAAGASTKPAKTPITLQMLLNMTSGLVYAGDAPDATLPERETARIQKEIAKKAAASPSFSTVEAASMLAQAPLLFEPGTAFFYGASADVMGGVIEAVTGKTPGAFMQEVLFSPLGMQDTAFTLEQKKLPRLSTLYTRANGMLQPADTASLLNPLMSADATCGRMHPCGAGLYSTLEDYMRFARMLLQEGTVNNTRVLGRKTVAFMRTSQMTPAVQKSFQLFGLEGYAYSNFCRILQSPAIGSSNGSIREFGWDGLPGCYFLIDPAENLTMVYMQQMVEGPDWEIRRKMRQILYAALD